MSVSQGETVIPADANDGSPDFHTAATVRV